MLSRISKKQIIILIVFLLLIFVVAINYWLESKKNADQSEDEIKKQDTIKETQEKIGGVIYESGYTISYEEWVDRLIITITDTPWEENEQKALNNLSERGIDYCSENVLVLAGRGTENHQPKELLIDTKCN